MSDAVMIAFIAAVPPTMVGVAALVVAMRSKEKLTELHFQINSRMDQLLEKSGALQRSEGRAEGMIAERRGEP